ncbi:cytochrome P450 [Streptomyces malaysiense]|uniref:Cytochrome n=1 Tax=Streptomyces malaysiense TaxID=1428626 RepID=A0A1J4Q9A7_9ACTN|nr:cytochrome P450 [Streptomyces malaysiense]OIK28719.1 hypothetical protein VT52_005030 [Streptomyces malaysiense]
MKQTIPELPAFPERSDDPFAPAPPYPALDPDVPVSRLTMPTGEKIWLITSYELVRQVLADPRVSVDRMHPAYPVPLGFPKREIMQEAARRIPAFLGMDPPKHTAHRRLVIPDFTSKRVKEVRARVQEIVDDCLDDLEAAGSPADLVEYLAAPVPTLVVGDVLGIPPEDRSFIASRTKTLTVRDGDEAGKRTALQEMNEYLSELVARNEKEPGPGVIGRLVEKYRAAGMYDRRTMMGSVMVILHGGKDGPANTIALGTVALLQDPEQLARLKADPALFPGAVEELLRFFSSSAEGACYRVATADIELGDVTIREGEGLLAFVSAANRDPRAFENPDVIDIGRDARGHVGFGYGVHQCLGQHLTRLQLDVAFSTLFARFPDLRLAVPAEELKYKFDNSTYGIWEVPVAW